MIYHTKLVTGEPKKCNNYTSLKRKKHIFLKNFGSFCSFRDNLILIPGCIKFNCELFHKLYVKLYERRFIKVRNLKSFSIPLRVIKRKLFAHIFRHCAYLLSKKLSVFITT